MTRVRTKRLVVVAMGVAAVLAAPAAVRGADGQAPATLARAVHAVAPHAVPVPGGWRFQMQDVVVSVLADEASGLVRVVVRAGDLSDRDVGLVASALGPDLSPDSGPRVVSVRGFMCAAVLAPLRGLTDAGLRRAVDGAIRGAREAAIGPGVLGPVGTAGAAPNRADGRLLLGGDLRPGPIARE